MDKVRIDLLESGDKVLLKLDGGSYGKSGRTVEKIFKGIRGEKKFRTAVFIDDDGSDWVLHRYMGRWSYGDNQDKVRLLEVLDN